MSSGSALRGVAFAPTPFVRVADQRSAHPNFRRVGWSLVAADDGKGTAVDRKLCTGYEPCFVRREKQDRARDVERRAHSAERVRASAEVMEVGFGCQPRVLQALDRVRRSNPRWGYRVAADVPWRV